MTKEEFASVLDSDEVHIIDIREAEELLVSPKLLQATHVPLSEYMTEPEKHNLPKDKKIVSVCQSGGRCLSLTNKLKQDGYQADYLEGGMSAWGAAS